MSSRLVLLCACLIAASSTAAHAADSAALTGIPMIEDSATFRIDGKRIDLWGVDALAADQQCWRGETAWDCGEQATTTLNHFIDNQQVHCQVKSTEKDRVFAQCSIDKNGKITDIAAHMVNQGWAMDRSEISDGLYERDEQAARSHRRGIWTSRFQTAADWKNGVRQFIEYDMEPESVITPQGDLSDVIVGPAEFMQTTTP